jgi:prephenate dehydrogenase
MWQNISVENKAEILNVIKEFKILLSEYENNLLNEDSEALLHYFDRAKNYRDTFSNRNIASFNKYYEILVDILDQTGAIATIATLLSVNNINIKNIGIINNREYEHGVLQVLFDNEETLQKSIRLLKKMNYTVYVKH